jgi:hypothetical protein
MTKEDLKKLIQEVYKEVASEPKAEKAKAEKPKSAPAAEKPAVKKVAKAVKAVAPKAEDPRTITKSFVKTIDKHRDKNKFAGDPGDANLFKNLGLMLGRHIGRTLEESDVEKMMEEMECEECYEEGAKPDFLDFDGDGNETEPMKKAAMDAKTSKKLKEIIEKAKNI